MTDIKPIRDSKDYDDAVAQLSALIDTNPAANTPDDSKIMVLTALIEDYENSTLPDYQVDPIEAIKLRIDQLGLKDVDLAPYLGSRSRVSEILSGKRPLTVSMIKNLEEGLSIPASILVGSSAEKRNKRWSPKTLALMARRGYFGDNNKNLAPKLILEMGLIRNIFSPQTAISGALLRQTNYRDISNVDKYHMEAWANKVLIDAENVIENYSVKAFDKSNLHEKLISKLFKLSSESDGVIKVINALRNLGIVVIIEPHLPTTRLDGATFFVDTHVVIGLTIRHDRMDNFWFTLAHELAHVFLHWNNKYSVFYDHLFNSLENLSDIETEADNFAGELLIPSDKWKLSPLRYGSTPTLVKMFADQIGVHESIVAGRIRHDSHDWLTHTDLINSEKVRYLFEDKIW